MAYSQVLPLYNDVMNFIFLPHISMGDILDFMPKHLQNYSDSIVHQFLAVFDFNSLFMIFLSHHSLLWWDIGKEESFPVGWTFFPFFQIIFSPAELIFFQLRNQFPISSWTNSRLSVIIRLSVNVDIYIYNILNNTEKQIKLFLLFLYFSFWNF